MTFGFLGPNNIEAMIMGVGGRIAPENLGFHGDFYKFQPMVNWWFGFLGSPHETDCYLAVLVESQTTNPS